MPILGVIASAFKANVDNGTMIPLAAVTLSEAQTTVSFSSIPQTYRHLQLRWFVRTNASNVESWQSLRFNSNTSGYTNHILYGTGSGSALATTETLNDRINFGTTAGNTAGANTFGSGVIDILDYRNTSKNKTVRFVGGYDNNGAGMVVVHSGLWANTTAISSITVGPQNFGGVAYLAGCTFALYGIKE